MQHVNTYGKVAVTLKNSKVSFFISKRMTWWADI